MQEPRNTCFVLKKHSTTLRQAKTGKYECRNITATYVCGALFSLYQSDDQVRVKKNQRDSRVKLLLGKLQVKD